MLHVRCITTGFTSVRPSCVSTAIMAELQEDMDPMEIVECKSLKPDCKYPFIIDIVY